ncbi:MAG: efflux RND transporter periplasmic adaptor subunit, partial [Pseudomonadota bacterium]
MNLNPLLIIPPIAAGVAGFIWMTQPQETPQEAGPESSLAVRTLAVVAELTVVTATGYGRVEAARSWAAVSEVEGRVTEVFDGLSIGSIVE